MLSLIILSTFKMYYFYVYITPSWFQANLSIAMCVVPGFYRLLWLQQGDVVSVFIYHQSLIGVHPQDRAEKA